jgi:hypothetical protein
MVVLKVKVASALRALPAVALEDRAAHLAWDGLTLAPDPGSVAFLDVEQHVSPVQPLRRSSLTISDQSQYISLAIPA